MTDEDGVCVRQECSHRRPIFYVTDSVIVSLFKPRKHVKLLLCRQASCVKLFFNYLIVEFYYRLSLILEKKYRDADKSITRGIFFIAINDNEKLITIKYRDKLSR